MRLRRNIVTMLDESCAEVERESGMPTTPRAELLVVDRHAWIGGNLRTFERIFGDVELGGAEAKLVAWEGGAFIGFVSRVVLAQFDPFRDQLIVVYPNLGEMARGSGLRFLLFHEVTHLAQFRTAPWIPDRIVELGRDVLSLQQTGWTKDALAQARERLPDIVRWLRAAVEGKTQDSPLLDLLPEAQRGSILKLNSLVTLLEGHATHVTDLIGRRVIDDYDELKARIEQRRKRPPLLRILEAVAGLDMKRQQYVVGRDFCEQVWQQGGADALTPAWRGPEWIPTVEELREPALWLDRVKAASTA